MLNPDFNALFHDLAEQGVSISDGLLPADLIDALYDEALLGWNEGRFADAHVGHARRPQRITAIRGDSILWLEPEARSGAEGRFLDWAETLRQELNLQFYLGLQRSEFHFARYDAGQGYARHFDQHRNEPHRRITLTLYLTPDWQADDGGELCLYRPDNPEQEWLRVLPQRGRMVLFRSELIPHAVMPARKTRWSMTGWFRNDSLLLRAA